MLSEIRAYSFVLHCSISAVHLWEGVCNPHIWELRGTEQVWNPEQRSGNALQGDLAPITLTNHNTAVSLINRNLPISYQDAQERVCRVPSLWSKNPKTNCVFLPCCALKMLFVWDTWQTCVSSHLLKIKTHFSSWGFQFQVRCYFKPKYIFMMKLLLQSSGATSSQVLGSYHCCRSASHSTA